MYPISRKVASPSKSRVSATTIVVVVLIVLGLYGRFVAAVDTTIWVDEAESAINALTILEDGVPTYKYMGIPIFENTLTEPATGSEEYEFRDSSYSKKGMAVYHGWLPLYSIALAEYVAGMQPDLPTDPARVRHTESEVMWRIIVPRMPAIIFSAGFMAVIFVAGRELGGLPAGCAALAWVAVGYRGILYGHQSRYYSLTLLMSGLFFVVLLRTLKRGRFTDFALLGLVVGLLFHTHQLSAFVACCVAATGIFEIVRQQNWVRKCLLSALVAALLILPWLFWSGFLGTLSTVPKAYHLFTEFGGWTRYLFQRWREVSLGLAGFAGIFVVRRMMMMRGVAVSDHLKLGAGMLLTWIGLGLLAFHILVPAASFFPGRLTLMLLTPYSLLVCTAVGLAWQLVSQRHAVLLSIVSIVLVLAGFGELGRFSLPRFRAGQFIVEGLHELANQRFPPGTRFYAAPNDHLLWTYFSGLPVQSIAPIRKDFLDSYGGAVVYIERRFEVMAKDEEVVRAAERSGIAIGPGEVGTIVANLWRSHVGETLRAGGMQVDVPTVPPFLEELSSLVKDRTSRSARAEINYYRHHPMFAGQAYSDPNEMWFTFYYRFVTPSQRVGVHANFRDRLRGARVTLVPGAGFALFHSPAPHRPENFVP